MSNLPLDGLTDSQKRLFAVRCVRRVQHLLTDPESVAALDVAERHALGQATDEELAAARAEAWDASMNAAEYVERAATDAAWASHAAASAALWATTSATASAAVRAAGEARDAASAAARDAEREAQAKILDQIKLEPPRFGRGTNRSNRDERR